MNESGIYQILNMTNGKRYIGSAVNLRQRWAEHRARLRHNRHGNDHPNVYLQNAWNLYGGAAFVFSVLEYVSDLENLVGREQHYMDELHPEYNLCPVAGSCFGMVRSDEARARMSAAKMGKAVSDETRRRMRGENNPNAKLTDEAVLEIRTLLAENVLSPKQIADRYGVSWATINSIRAGHTWTHLRVPTSKGGIQNHGCDNPDTPPVPCIIMQRDCGTCRHLYALTDDPNDFDSALDCRRDRSRFDCWEAKA